MKPLTVCIQVSAVVVVLFLSYYLGRPIYYESLVKSQDAASQSTEDSLLSGTNFFSNSVLMAGLATDLYK